MQSAATGEEGDGSPKLSLQRLCNPATDPSMSQHDIAPRGSGGLQSCGGRVRGGSGGGCGGDQGGGGGGDGEGDGEGGGGGCCCTRVPQPMQSVPKAQSAYSEPGPPSSQ